MPTLIHTPTPNLDASRAFYRSLGFTPVAGHDECLWTGDGILVQINPERTARAGLRLFADDWTAVVEDLSAMAPVARVGDDWLAVDPSGVWIYLSPPADAPFPAASSHTTLLGTGAGLSLETGDLARSLRFWAVLGWTPDEALPADPDEHPAYIGAMGPDGLGIAWMRPGMCRHLFYNPSLTYFNSGKNPEIIEGLRGAGIPITEEITVFNDAGEVDNVIVRDPGGYGFFVFND